MFPEGSLLSRSQKVDLVSFHFIFFFPIFLFSFLSYSPFVLFLVYRTRIGDGRGHVIQRGF